MQVIVVVFSIETKEDLEVGYRDYFGFRENCL